MEFNRVQAYSNNFFWLFLTYLLAPYFYFQIFLLARRSPAKRDEGGRRSIPLKILVIQAGKIGDLVCTTPLFRAIKEKFPSAHLTVLSLSKAEGVLKNNPRIDEIIPMTNYAGISGKLRLLSGLRKEKYDWAINILPHSFTNIISFWSLIPHRITTTSQYSGEIVGLLSVFNNHRLEYKKHTPLMGHYLNLLKFIGIEGSSEEKELFIKPAEEEKAFEFLRVRNLNIDDLLIGISVTAGIKLKEWEPQKFAILADKLIKEKNAKIIFIGSADDRSSVERVQKIMQNNSINACGFFELSELPALLKKLKLFISVDTGPLYMADALGVPVVDIVGPIDVKELYPLNKRCKIIQKKIYCAPCAHMLRAFSFCPEGHLRCFREITPEEIFEAAEDLLGPL